MSKASASGTDELTTAEWLRSVLDGRVLDTQGFYSEVVRYRKMLRDSVEKKDGASAKRLLLVYQVGSCTRQPRSVEERNIRKSFLRDARLICAHGPALVDRLHLYFRDDLEYIEDAELDATDREMIRSEILKEITVQTNALPFPASPVPDVHNVRVAAVWGDLRLARLLEEQAAKEDYEHLHVCWRMPLR